MNMQPRREQLFPEKPSTAHRWPVALLAAALLTASGCTIADNQRSQMEDEPQDSSQPMTPQHHTIYYIEISAIDLVVAKQFYSEAFGWEFHDYGPEYAGIAKADGGEVGGLRLVPEVQAGGPLVILYSADLEASVKAVQDAGGTIVVAPFSFPGGRRFQFSDPSGNELAVATIE